MLGEERLDELTALAEAASVGPWREGQRTISCPVIVDDRDVRVADINRDADLAFIAAARTAVPELIAEVRRLHKGIEELADDYELVDAEQLRALLTEGSTDDDDR